MRADHAVRHNAAVGALIGLAVGDALSTMTPLPPTVCGGATELLAWGSTAATAFEAAEALLSKELLDMGLGATTIVAAAIALADPDASPPLLSDPDAVLICALVRAGMLGELDLDPSLATAPTVTDAIQATLDADSFTDALRAAPAASLPLVGALAGLRWGPGVIPAAWSTPVTGRVGNHTYGLRQVRRLAERLMQQDAPVPPEPRRSLGPREVAPGLFLSNLHAVPRFLVDHPDGAVISMCPTTGAFDNHLIRREFAVHDAAGRAVNPHLSATIDEVLLSIRSFHAEGRNVLVHCHHGASRTGLVLRSWLVEELGLDADDATTEAQVRWPKTSTWNKAFANEVSRRAAVSLSERQNSQT